MYFFFIKTTRVIKVWQMAGKGNRVSVGRAKSRSEAASLCRLSNSHIPDPRQLFIIQRD